MSVTTAQVLANRANAKLSTGPKTEAGKDKSSRNATTHGFYSKAFIVSDAERADFETLRDSLHGPTRSQRGTQCRFKSDTSSPTSVHSLRR